MHRFLAAVWTLAFLIGLSTSVDAKQCRDAKGRFVKCKTTTHATVKKPCRDAKGKFVKCKPAKAAR